MTATLLRAGYVGVAMQAPVVTTASDGGSSNSGAGAGTSGSSGTGAGAGDGNVAVIAGAAAGGVVLIGGIVALVLCLRMKKRTGDSRARLAPMGGSGAGGDGNSDGEGSVAVNDAVGGAVPESGNETNSRQVELWPAANARVHVAV
jgi:hypothetical protein